MSGPQRSVDESILTHALVAVSEGRLEPSTPFRDARKIIDKSAGYAVDRQSYYRYWGDGLSDQRNQIVPAMLRDLIDRASNVPVPTGLTREEADRVLRLLKEELGASEHPALRRAVALLKTSEDVGGDEREQLIVRARGCLGKLPPKSAPAADVASVWLHLVALTRPSPDDQDAKAAREALAAALRERIEWEKDYRESRGGGVLFGMPVGTLPPGLVTVVQGADAYLAALVALHVRTGLTLTQALEAANSDARVLVGMNTQGPEVLYAEAAAALLAEGRFGEAIDAYKALPRNLQDLEVLTGIAARIGRHAFVVSDDDLLADCIATLPEADGPPWEDGIVGGPELTWLQTLRAVPADVPVRLLDYWVQCLTEPTWGAWTPAETTEVLVHALDAAGMADRANIVAGDADRRIRRKGLAPADERRLVTFAARATVRQRRESAVNRRLDSAIDALYAAVLESTAAFDGHARRRLDRLQTLLAGANQPPKRIEVKRATERRAVTQASDVAAKTRLAQRDDGQETAIPSGLG